MAFHKNVQPSIANRSDIFFIDFQLLHYLDNQMIYKEFSMVNASNTVFRKCMYEPPAYCKEPSKTSCEYGANKWLRNHHHQLTWNQGIAPYYRIVDDVQTILSFKPKVV